MYKLNIGDVVNFDVDFSLGGVNHRVSFTANRMTVPELESKMSGEQQEVREYLLEKCTGWNQEIVLDENDAPAQYSKESFLCLLGILGMPRMVLQKLTEASAAREKN